MVAFPDLVTSVSPEHPFPEQDGWRTLITEFEGGNETRKQKRLYPRRSFPLKYRYISKTEARTLWRFFNARKGSKEAFNFFLPWSNEYAGEYVGTGDGSTTNYNAPSKTAVSVTVYVNGTAQTGGGTDYTLTQGGGADGADLIEFVFAPASGAQITMDFTGYLKVRSRFDEDLMDFQTFYNRLVNSGLKIRGLLNA
jgi:hypothetical protein